MCALLAVSAYAAGEEGNLLPNGSFENPKDALTGWRHNYVSDNNRWYRDNHRHVSVVPRDGTRKGVLKIAVPTKGLADNQGVKVDSMPTPFDVSKRYKLTLHGRTTGPSCRVLIEGYQWRPGVRPCENPTFHDLRKVYRQGAGNMLYFGSKSSGTFSGPARSWTPGACAFPGDSLSALASKHLKRVKFLSIHIVAIGGSAGDLFIDDVKLERTE